MTARRLRRPRWIQRLWARLGGYFWEPCPECGRMFGGHEASSSAVLVEQYAARPGDDGDPLQHFHAARAAAEMGRDGGWFMVCKACAPTVSKRVWAEFLARTETGR